MNNTITNNLLYNIKFLQEMDSNATVRLGSNDGKLFNGGDSTINYLATRFTSYGPGDSAQFVFKTVHEWVREIRSGEIKIKDWELSRLELSLKNYVAKHQQSGWKEGAEQWYTKALREVQLVLGEASGSDEGEFAFDALKAACESGDAFKIKDILIGLKASTEKFRNSFAKKLFSDSAELGRFSYLKHLLIDNPQDEKDDLRIRTRILFNEEGEDLSADLGQLMDGLSLVSGMVDELVHGEDLHHREKLLEGLEREFTKYYDQAPYPIVSRVAFKVGLFSSVALLKEKAKEWKEQVKDLQERHGRMQNELKEVEQRGINDEQYYIDKGHLYELGEELKKSEDLIKRAESWIAKAEPLKYGKRDNL